MTDHEFANLIKRMSHFLVLEILGAYTDLEHGLKVSEIVELLEQNYGVPMERKAVSRILNDLKALSDIPDNHSNWKLPMKYTILCDESPRRTGAIRDNWRLQGAFEDAEVRLLTDALLSVPNNRSERLLDKLKKLGSMQLRSNNRYIEALRENVTGNWEIPANVDALNRAIIKGRKVRFCYYEYGLDKKLHPRLTGEGKPRQYTVSPYQMLFRNGFYYLICNYDRYEDIAHYRIDRIRSVEVLEEPAKPFKSLAETKGWKLDIRQYVDEHIHMYSGKTVRAVFTVPVTMITDVIDIFGDKVDLEKNPADRVTVRADVNETAMLRFAKTFAPDVKLLAPTKLVEKLKTELESALRVYSDQSFLR